MHVGVGHATHRIAGVGLTRVERWLVTGALGCIGAWVVRVLVDQGADVTTLDLQTDGPRLDLVAGPDRLTGVKCVAGDIRELDVVRAAVADSGATHVVHLAALQVPFCRADPTLGAEVNVVGTVNVFQAAAESDRVHGLTYASSIAAYDAMDVGDMDAERGELRGRAGTLYGVYKRANEGTAHVYWQDHGVASIGLRPHTVYGAGRDQGLTSQPTLAMMAAARGEPFHIGFGGRLAMQYAEDVARDFIAAARAASDGAHVTNVTGAAVAVTDVIDAICDTVPSAKGSITAADDPLPFPPEVVADTTLFTPTPRTPLAAGVGATIAAFQR